MSLLSYQPFRGFYALVAFLINIIKLPFYILKYIVPSLRPHTSWTFHQSLSNILLRNFLHHTSVLRVPTPPKLSASPSLGSRLVSILPSSNESHYDFIESLVPNSSATIRPASIQGLWFPSLSPPSTSSSQPTTLHFHGGAYVTGSIDPSYIGYTASLLTTHVSPSVLFSNYRLASSTSDNGPNHFPAQLQDAITAYAYLLAQGVSAENIILSGDSCGANLVLALLRYIGSAAEDGKAGGLPMPKAALLWSPWLDIKQSLTPGLVESHPMYTTDYLSSAFILWGSRSLTVSNPKIATSPYVSFSGQPWRCETPLWVQAGSVEVLKGEIEEWVREMKGVQGNRVELLVKKGVSHDVVLTGDKTGFDKEGRECAEKAGEWIRGLGEGRIVG